MPSPALTSSTPLPSTLAELMLPDGAHARSEDWTVFFLPDATTSEAGRSKSSSSSSKPGLTYVINLVRTKHDSSVRRGALVKALAIGTKHPCLHIFKPALVLALDEYFSGGGQASLEQLYEAINAIDLSAMPRLSRAEKVVLRASERKDLFIDRFITPDAGDQAATPNAANGYHLGHESKTANHASIDHSARQPLTPIAPAQMARRPSAASLRSAMMATRIGSFNAVTQPAPSTPAPTGPDSPTMLSHAGKDTHFWVTGLHYGKVDVPIRWPTDNWDDEIGEVSRFDEVRQEIVLTLPFLPRSTPSLCCFKPSHHNQCQDRYTLNFTPMVRRLIRCCCSSMQS